MSSHQIDISDYEKDPRLFLFTSLTAGSSHIITATSRLETILKANRIPFQAIDLATDEKARRLWQRRARERKLPGLVKDGFVLGDLEEVEEWNEFGELKENIGSVPAHDDAGGHRVQTGVNIAPPIPVNTTATQGTTNVSQPPVTNAPKPGLDETKWRPLPGAAEIAARNRPSPEQAEAKSVVDENAPPKVETMSSAPMEKDESITAAKKLLKEEQSRGIDHLSAPPSALQSGTATPDPELADATKGTEKLAIQRGEEKKDEGQAAEKLTHRGSEVKDVSPEEIKKVESENALTEAAEEDAVSEKAETEEVPAVAASADEDAVSKKAETEEAPSVAAPAEAEGEAKEDASEARETPAAVPSDGGEAQAVATGEAEATETPAAVPSEGGEAQAVATGDEKAEATETPAAVPSDGGEAQAVAPVDEKAEAKDASAVTATDSGEGKGAEEVSEQSAKEGEDAGKSVGD